MYNSFLRLWNFQPNMSLLNRMLCMLLCLCVHVLGVLLCLHTCVLACLAFLRALVFGVLTCYMFACPRCLLVLCSYVLTCFTCLLCSNILHAYVLACFFDIVCPIFFAFEKLTSKNPHIEKFIFMQRSIKNLPEHPWSSF